MIVYAESALSELSAFRVAIINNQRLETIAIDIQITPHMKDDPPKSSANRDASDSGISRSMKITFDIEH